MTLEQLARQGRRQASMTTAMTVTSMMHQIRKESIKQAFSDFENVRHRYEYVDMVEGVSYYDDAGACSSEAAWFSFDNLHQQLVWITYANNADCDELIPQVRKYVKSIVCIGKNTERFHRVFSNIIPENIIDCDSIEEAVKMAHIVAEVDDCVIYSPASQVKDEFSSFAERGDYFKQCVQNLK